MPTQTVSHVSRPNECYMIHMKPFDTQMTSHNKQNWFWWKGVPQKSKLLIGAKCIFNAKPFIIIWYFLNIMCCANKENFKHMKISMFP